VTSSSAPDQRAAPLHLWRAASALLNTLFALLGGPEKLAAKHTLTAAAHKLAADWLRTAEALMRRLLLVEARAYPPPSSRQKTAGRLPAVRKRKLMGFDADKPGQWRVSFRCFLDRRRPRRREAQQHPQKLGHLNNADGPSFRSAWPLAERFEALIRVHNDPTPYAKRLARRLHARPQLIASVLSAPPDFIHGVPEPIVEELRQLCEPRVPAPDTT
jgi:hypothetical protein